LTVESSRIFESDLPETQPSMVLSGDFNGDAVPDLLLVDAEANHTIEILQASETGWDSVMHFPIFETAPGAGRRGGGRQPREVRVLDLNNDGLDDLLLLVHDRILLYLQDPVPSPEP
jgi:hypothetical protein